MWIYDEQILYGEREVINCRNFVKNFLVLYNLVWKYKNQRINLVGFIKQIYI